MDPNLPPLICRTCGEPISTTDDMYVEQATDENHIPIPGEPARAYHTACAPPHHGNTGD